MQRWSQLVSNRCKAIYARPIPGAHQLEGVNHIWLGAKPLLHISLSFVINKSACFHGVTFGKLNSTGEAPAPAWICLFKSYRV